MEPSNPTQPRILPRVSLDSGDGFDYTYFSLDDDINYLTGDGAPGSILALDDMSSVMSPGTAFTRSSLAQRQRYERRGHTKSRRGCYNCKRRRIKCQETRPACAHCTKTGLKCEYPAVPRVIHQPQNQVLLFSLQDMRLFQHFLQTCFPHQPLGNETIWTHEIPCLSQNYEYLMHAILGLAASDLMSQDPNLVTFAMSHRLKAIRAIKKALSEVPKSNTFEEGNALIATCFALTFQSVVLEDGMAEFMTFCRGITLVSIQMCTRNTKFLFRNLHDNESAALLRPFMEALPPIRRDWVDMAVSSIRGLGPLCEQHEVETEYRRLLLDMAAALGDSAFRAYEFLCKHYGWWIQLPHARFQRLVDPENQTCTLLAAHWIAIKQIMAPVTETEHRLRAREPRHQNHDQDGDGSNKNNGSMNLGMVRWLKYLNRQVDAEHRRYNDWPAWVEEQLDRDPTFFGRTLLP
ncbi:hypothetical protein F4813DRAFT_389604 [Daldinia decipiens]|uniref:uncharacterized protein n=1 Tax=Daldinia decipiens TaxID=326647 RepID=UPI0020C1E8FC|nr:uncharacterized protein F4813DRAFT_389604 [Daldinia decipiens]KAI1657427.1 hypothetical protein F4813DRAFT_389604 [Daldinia decipiens]